jgi:signal peptidase I
LDEFQTEIFEPPIKERRKTPVLIRVLLEILETLVIALVLYFLIDAVVARVRVENISMKPTLQPGEFLIVNKLAYRFSDYQHGDIVVFHHTVQEDYIKRVIGVPGDQVVISGGQVMINGSTLNEPYIAAPPDYTGNWTVPEGMLFVLGDNRNLSSDSHKWGFVPEESVVGKALVVYWPLNDAKLLTKPLIVNAED